MHCILMYASPLLTKSPILDLSIQWLTAHEPLTPQQRWRIAIAGVRGANRFKSLALERAKAHYRPAVPSTTGQEGVQPGVN
jgi:hypothetical protein